MTNQTCECAAASALSFRCVEEAVHGQLGTAIINGSELVARASNKWGSIYRCRTCGAHWVEAYAGSGMMDIQHLYPLPAGVADPAAWLEVHGESLPFRRWL
jgi:hypothetical protein